MKCLKTNYKIFESEINDILEKCKTYNIKNYEIDDDGLLTVYDNVEMSGINSKKLPLKFKEVNGYFKLSRSMIECLNGSPQIVYGDYFFNHTRIKNLKYCPKEVYGNFTISNNYFLKRFIEFPIYIGKNININSCGLISLFGCINAVSLHFNINDNKSLKSLKYGPKRVDGSYCCSSCCLITLYGAPKYVGCDFNCSNNNLISLKYSPKYIGRDLNFRNNNIKSFEYFPEHVGGYIYCDNTPVFKIWELFEDKKHIEYFNQMKIIKDGAVNVKKLNLFLMSIDKNPLESLMDMLTYSYV